MVFSNADRYLAHRTRNMRAVREPGKRYPFPYSERHLHCIWYDAALRPTGLRTHDGLAVQVVDPGRWNLEAGPDFLDTVLRIDTRRLKGDIEVHISPMDWNRHAHGNDPLYQRVIAHVTYFAGQLPDTDLPAGAVQVAIEDPLKRKDRFSFESIDLTAYPYTGNRTDSHLADMVAGWSTDEIGDLLEDAGTARLREKATRLEQRIDRAGAEQTLFEEIMSALGYKHNRIAFRTLAQRLPIGVLRNDAAGDPLAAYALLLGVAGLLPNQPGTSWDEETRHFVRHMWDTWWRHAENWHARVGTADDWTLRNLRPHNHPLRRLMAAAAMATDPRPLDQRIAALALPDTHTWRRDIDIALGCHCEGYWQHRLRLAGNRQEKAIAMVGTSRLAAIGINIIIPYLSLLPAAAALDPLLTSLPAAETDSIVRQTAHALLGPDHNPAFYRTALRQQGLHQIFQDYCLNRYDECDPA